MKKNSIGSVDNVINIRITRARLCECNDLVRLHLSAFKGFFLTCLGPRFLRLVYSDFIVNTSGFALVAKRSGHIVGFVVGTSQPSEFFRTVLLSRWWRYGLAALEGIRRAPFGVIERCFSAVLYRGEEPGAVSARPALLSSLAVDPNFTGGRIGSALVSAFVAEAVRANCDSVYLVTDHDANERVNRFYLSCGFTLLDRISRRSGRVMNRWLMLLPSAS